MKGRRALAAAGVLGLAGGGAAVAGVANSDPSALSSQATRGLAVRNYAMTGMVIERDAVAGATDRREIANNSNESLTITVKARPWIQSSSGAVSPNRKKELSKVQVSSSTFTLAPGDAKTVDIKLLTATPTFGVLEVIGLPADVAKRKGVVTGYRILNSLRYNPPAKTYALKPGAVKLTGKGAARKLVVKVKNTGNTTSPVAGRVALKGPLGTRNGSVKSTRILPGKTVQLALWSTRRLQAGSYTATIRLTQAKKTTKITKRVKITR